MQFQQFKQFQQFEKFMQFRQFRQKKCKLKNSDKKVLLSIVLPRLVIVKRSFTCSSFEIFTEVFSFSLEFEPKIQELTSDDEQN